MHRRIFFIILILIISSCKDGNQSFIEKTLFKKLDSKISGISFENRLVENDSMNFFRYSYFYSGAGVATGDLNGDDLVDLFFTSNMNSNELYLNQGNLKFEEIGTQAGTQSFNKWHTGCSMIDINADGLLDISVSVAGIWNDRQNLLYINQGNDENGIPIFAEMAANYGLNDSGFSVQTAFFDYDQDGDIDVYVLNYPPTPFNSKVMDYKKFSEEVTLENSDHLYRNNGDNTFTDVTIESGILNFGLGMGILTMDFNNDNLTDIYVSNDFHTPDFFYVNNGDGTFTESLKKCFQQTSFYGMGIDAADINNDGLTDLMQVDMTAVDNYRSKSNMLGMNISSFYTMLDVGFHYQYMHNSLQVNNGIRPNGLPFFSNVSKLHKVDRTDWSWSSLFADYDNDGFQDLFITNGIKKDINNNDYFKWLKQLDTKIKVKYNELSLVDLSNKMPSKKIDNYIYKNENGTFHKANEKWGVTYEGFSNGTSYADLDNDGDLELILNNIDSTAVIFENQSDSSINHFLKIKLIGSIENPLGLGAKIKIYSDTLNLTQEQSLVRGYQSSTDPIMHFGLGKNTIIDSIKVFWKDGKVSFLENIKSNTTVKIQHKNSFQQKLIIDKKEPLFELVSEEKNPFKYKHVENEFNDFEREVLLPHKMSSFGPGIAIADVNNDRQEDLFVSGAKGFPSYIFISKKTDNTNYKFEKTTLPNPQQEEVDGIFHDINADGLLDLLTVSGGNEEDDLKNSFYKQRIYQQQRNHEFKEVDLLEEAQLSAALVLVNDFDNDAKLDIFYGGRQIPSSYPKPATSYLFSESQENSNKKTTFEKRSSEIIPELKEIGMMTDAVWSDYDLDGDEDLIAVGEWMPISFFENQNGKLTKVEIPEISDQVGWWKNICKGDFDLDGDTDFVVLNLGLNYKYKANEKETFDCYANDFDKNSNLDIVLGYYQEGEQFPVRGRSCSAEQVPEIKRKFKNYHTFASSTIDKIYGQDKLKSGLHLQANQFNHIYIENKGNGQFKSSKLSFDLQASSYNCAMAMDVNSDGYLDLVLAGNIFDAEIETPRSDAEYGTVAIGDGKGNFKKLSYKDTGLYIPYETQDIDIITIGKEKYVLFANNNGPLLIYKLNISNQNTNKIVSN